MSAVHATPRRANIITIVSATNTHTGQVSTVNTMKVPNTVKVRLIIIRLLDLN